MSRTLATMQALEEERAASVAWEARAQAGLAHSERLKDLLEVSASWPPAAGESAAGSATRAGVGGGGGDGAAQQAAAMRRELLAEQARTADLQVQVCRQPPAWHRCLCLLCLWTLGGCLHMCRQHRAHCVWRASVFDVMQHQHSQAALAPPSHAIPR